jgi:hypothetical protein
MTKPKPLTRRQLAVLDELFADEPDDDAILKKYKVDAKLYNKWLTEPAFVEQLDKHMMAAHRRSALHLARSAPKAASRLVALSQRGEGETTRKACLDIILMQNSLPTGDQRQETTDDGRETSDELPPETASRVLAALADEARNKQCAVEACMPDVTCAKEGTQTCQAESIPQESAPLYLRFQAI